MKCRLRPRVRRSGATHLAGVVEGPDFVRVQRHRLPELVRVVVRAQQASRGLAAEPDLRLGGASRGGDARGDRGDYAEREQRERERRAPRARSERHLRAHAGDPRPLGGRARVSGGPREARRALLSAVSGRGGAVPSRFSPLRESPKLKRAARFGHVAYRPTKETAFSRTNRAHLARSAARRCPPGTPRSSRRRS